MVKGLYTAHTGLVNQQNRLDVLTNNLANAATTAYKKEGTTTTTFGETLAVKIKDTSDYGMPKKLGEITPGVKIGENYTDYGQGAFRITDNIYDLALDGEGFFAISFTNKAGETFVKYTRDGAFTVNWEGYLVTKDGDFVLNQEGALSGQSAEENFILINPNKELIVDERGYLFQENQQIGKVGIIDIEDYNYIQKYGENMYEVVEGGQVQESQARVLQGALEMSNVNVVSEMVEMITISRAFESNQKIMQTIDSTLEKAANNLSRL